MSWKKGVLIGIAILVSIYFARAVFWSSTPEHPPRGFPNENLLRLALAVKWIKLVNAEPAEDESVIELHDRVYKTVGEDTCKLDIFRSKDQVKPAPCLVFIHGGGWRSGKKEDYRLYQLEFARKGFVTVSINYRLVKSARFPAAVNDAKCAIQWLRAHASEYLIDPRKFAVIGGSAGGHLSMMVGYSSDDDRWNTECSADTLGSQVSAVVNLYGPVDLTTEYGSSHSLTRNFMGVSYQERTDLYRRASPRFYISPDDPPTLTFHGTIDGLVPVSQADSLDRWLQSAGVHHEYHRLKGWPHAMDLAKPVNDYVQHHMLQFFNHIFQDSSE
jgi:acetyl esterase/lipase